MVLVASTGPRIKEVVDTHQFRREMSDVPARDLPAAIQKAPNTEIGQLFGGVFKIAEDMQKQLQAIVAEVDDPSLADVLEPSTLGDKTSRDAALATIAVKQKIIAGLPARTDGVYTEMATKVSAFSEDYDRRHGGTAGSSVIAGMNKTLPNAREMAKAYAADLGAFYADIADLIRFLDSPDGTPTLAQDKLYFKADQALADFRRRAERVDADRAKVLQDVQAQQQAYQSRLENLKGSLGKL
jgi:hypothetical protein